MVCFNKILGPNGLTLQIDFFLLSNASGPIFSKEFVTQFFVNMAAKESRGGHSWNTWINITHMLNTEYAY